MSELEEMLVPSQEVIETCGKVITLQTYIAKIDVYSKNISWLSCRSKT